jgi:YD repeat-containing protein
MKTEQNQVKEFMIKAGQECPAKPTAPPLKIRELRIRLIAEELLELVDAQNCILTITYDKLGRRVVEITAMSHDCNIVESYDAILDLMVVTIGAGVAQGFDLQPGWDEVHRSNMSKFIDGHRREDGKWVKGPSYSPAQLGPIFDAQK